MAKPALQTIPHKDPLVPELKVSLFCYIVSIVTELLSQDAWRECKLAFGEGNVLIVSNSAGTARDSGEIQVGAYNYAHALFVDSPHRQKL